MRSRHALSIWLVAIFSACLPVTALAVAANSFPRSLQWAEILQKEAVLKELKLSQDQRAVAKRVIELPAADARRAIITSLTPTQVERLQQIAWQLDGGFALFDPDMVNALDVTPQQAIVMKGISKKRFAQMTESLRYASFISMKGKESYMSKRRSEAGEEMVASLRADQQSAYGRLLGKPFEVDRVSH